jgi:hypothetical protein
LNRSARSDGRCCGGAAAPVSGLLNSTAAATAAQTVWRENLKTFDGRGFSYSKRIIRLIGRKTQKHAGQDNHLPGHFSQSDEVKEIAIRLIEKL